MLFTPHAALVKTMHVKSTLGTRDLLSRQLWTFGMAGLVWGGSKAAAGCRGMFKEMLECAGERVALGSFLDGTIDSGLKVVGGGGGAPMSKFPRSTVQAQNPNGQGDLFDPGANGPEQHWDPVLKIGILIVAGALVLVAGSN